jgi:hypothetical protein
MHAMEATQFEDAAKYSSFLRTPLARLRSELAWKHLPRFMPAGGFRRRKKAAQQ